MVYFLGTDTIKRGASPASASIESNSTTRFKESTSSYSIKQETLEKKTTIKYEKCDIKKTDSVLGPINNQSEPLSEILAYSTSVSFKDSPTPPTTKSSPLESSTSNKVDENISLYKPISYSSTSVVLTTSSPTPSTTGLTTKSSTLTSIPASNIYSSAHLNSLLRNTNNDKINNMSNSNVSNNSNNGSSSSQSYENIGKSYMGTYQFPSSHLKSTLPSTDATESATTAYISKLDDFSFKTTTSSISKVSSSSPLKINDTMNSKTLGSTKYQSENYNNTFSSNSSPVSSSNQSQLNSEPSSSICGTLPKTSPNLSANSPYTTGSISNVDNTISNSVSGNFLSKYTSNFTLNYSKDFINNLTVNSSASETVVSTSRSDKASSSGDNESDLYPVQYSSTNPFLPTFNPISTEKPTDKLQNEDSDNISLHIRGSNVGNESNGFSGINKIAKLDKDDDLK